MQHRLQRHSASLVTELHAGGVLEAVLSGPITPSTLVAFKASAEAVHGAWVRSYLVDYRRAALALDGDALDAVVSAPHLTHIARLPAALLVQPALVDFFIAHAARMALHRIRRRVFIERAPALQWLASLELPDLD